MVVRARAVLNERTIRAIFCREGARLWCARAVLNERIRAMPALASALALLNAGFEEGSLRGWEVLCGSPRCADTRVDRADGRLGSTQAAVLQCSADDWTSVRLRQQLRSPPVAGPVALDAWVRAGSDSWSIPSAPIHFRAEVRFEGDEGEAFCQSDLTELPSSWERLRVRCGGAPADARRAWVVLHYACVRGAATLQLDDVTLSSLDADDAETALAPKPSTAPPAIPRVVHVIFGLSSDFGGKPFGLVHHLTIKAALHFARPADGRVYFHHAHEPRGQVIALDCT